MDIKIKQITEDEVIPCIVDNKTVFRANLDRLTMCDLSSKSVATIRNDFGKARFVYFVVEGENE